ASGRSVSSAGDVNGDGFDDLLIGKSQGGGESYVIFGGTSLPPTTDLAILGAAGIRIVGDGFSVSNAGDINGDGFEDLLLGGVLNGSYVIFGGASLPATISLATLGSAGIKILGVDAGDASGFSVSSAGDVNGDGFDDLLVGAPYADASGNLKSDAGESYVIFGGNFTTSVTHSGTSGADTLTGTSGSNVIIGGRGNDTLIGNLGVDVLYGGQGADVLAIQDVGFFQISGGTGIDTLRLDSDGLFLDLTMIPDNRLNDIETIDLRGTAQIVKLSALELFNLSDSSNTLIVTGSIDDLLAVIDFDTLWQSSGTQTISGTNYNVYTSGAATLLVSGVAILSAHTLVKITAASGFTGASSITFTANDAQAVQYDFHGRTVTQTIDVTVGKGGIYGTVFDDRNGNGVEEPNGGAGTERGVEGTVVYLDENGNVQFDSGSERSTLTDANGHYAFPGAEPRRNQVRVAAADHAAYTTSNPLVTGIENAAEYLPTFSGSAPGITPDGRYVVFVSSDPLSPLDTSGIQNVYRKDRVTGNVTLVSTNIAGTGSGNAGSTTPVISADGAVIAFSSYASNLVAGDTNNNSDVFVRNLLTNTTTLISVKNSGSGSGNGFSGSPAISSDGTGVAFLSYASDIVAGDTNNNSDVFVRNVLSSTTTLVSVKSSGTNTGNLESGSPVLSADGNVVAFTSSANDLVTGDSNNARDVFVRNLTTNTTTLVSVNISGSGSGNLSSDSPTLNADGKIVAFNSYASDLVSSDSNNTRDVFVRNLTTNTTTLASVNNSGTGSGSSQSYSPALSADGNVVAFQSQANNLVVGDSNSGADIFVRNLIANTTMLVSISSTGTSGGNGSSQQAVLSADGNFVAFRSFASDLVTGDSNGNTQDVFVRNLTTNSTTLVSVKSSGTGSGTGDSDSPVLSANGGVVAFASVAADLTVADSNQKTDVFLRELSSASTELISSRPRELAIPILTPNGSSHTYDYNYVNSDGRYFVLETYDSLLPLDTNSQKDIYLKDRLTGALTLISVNSAGTGSGNQFSDSATLSADGKVVAFNSYASDLVVGDANDTFDVFVRNLTTNTTTLVSVKSSGAGSGNQSSSSHVLSADGKVVAFTSDASDLVAGDSNNAQDVFVRNLTTNTTTLVSVKSSGAGSGNNYSGSPVLSADGKVVAFRSSASDLVAGDANNTTDVFVRNLTTNTTTLVSVKSSGAGSGNNYSDSPKLSADGSVVAFTSTASDLVTGDANSALDVFVRNLTTNTTTLVSVKSSGSGSGNNSSSSPVLSTDGKSVAFTSFANDLVAVDANSTQDVFVRNLTSNTTTLVSVNSSGTGSGNSSSSLPALSADGKVVAFTSAANDLVAVDANSAIDVFVRNLTTNTTTLVSVKSSGSGSGNNLSSAPVLSADGKVVAFTSDASDLVPNDVNNKSDLFVVQLDRLMRPTTLPLVSKMDFGLRRMINIGVDRTVFENSLVSLSAIVPSAAFDTILSYAWSVSGGPATIIGTSNAAAFEFRPLDGTASGTKYTAIVTVTGILPGQSTAFSFTDSVDVFVSNVAPTASIGGPYVISEGGSLLLNAGASIDPAGVNDALTFSWDLDNDGQFDNNGTLGSSSQTRDVTWSQLVALGINNNTLAGAPRTVRVRVMDGDGGESIASTTLTVNNSPPAAIAGGPYSITAGIGSVLPSMNGSGTIDPSPVDQLLLMYFWDIDLNRDNSFSANEQGLLAGVSPSLTWQQLKQFGITQAGVNKVQLRAIDPDGAVNTSPTTTLTIDNMIPDAHAGGLYTILESQSLTLDGSQSTDLDSHSLSFVWDLNGDGLFDANDGTNRTGQVLTLAWSELVAIGLSNGPATRDIRLQVSDGYGGVNSVGTNAVASIVIDNAPPTADILIVEPWLLSVPSEGSQAGGIADLQTFAAIVGSTKVTFEFDTNNSVAAGNRRIAIDAGQTQSQLRSVILAALNHNDNADLRLRAYEVSTNGIRLGGRGTHSFSSVTSKLQFAEGRAAEGDPDSSYVLFTNVSDVQQDENDLRYRIDIDRNRDGDFDDPSETGTWELGDPVGATNERRINLNISNDGSYEIRAVVSDQQAETAYPPRTVDVANVAPRGDLYLQVDNFNEGQTIVFGLNGVVDPGVVDVVRYKFDLNDDGFFDTFDHDNNPNTLETDVLTTPTRPLTLYTNGVHRLRVLAFDEKDSNLYTQVLTINNVAPTVSSFAATTSTSVVQGGTVQFTGAFSDPGEADDQPKWTGQALIRRAADSVVVATAPLAINPTTKEMSVEYAFADDGDFTVSALVTDGETLTTVESSALTVTVSNVLPIIDPQMITGVVAGRTLRRVFSFTDPGSDSWTWSANLGDGNTVGPTGTGGQRSFELNHTYSAPGTYNLFISVSDGTGVSSATFPLVVSANQAPTVASPIPDLLITPQTTDRAFYADLQQVFSDKEDLRTELVFSVQGNSNPALITPTIGLSTASTTSVSVQPLSNEVVDWMAMLVQPDGKLVYAGSTIVSGDWIIVRIKPNGNLDSEFGTNGVTRILGASSPYPLTSLLGLSLQANGKLVVSGGSLTGGSLANLLVRLTATGQLDDTSHSGTENFNGNGFVRHQASAVDADSANVTLTLSDGGLLAIGVADPIAGGITNGLGVVRLSSGGVVQSSTIISSLASNFAISDATLDQAGRAVIVGATYDASYTSASERRVLLRLNAEGTGLDPTFGNGGSIVINDSDQHIGLDVELDSRGRIIVASYHQSAADNTITTLVDRFLPNGVVDQDFGVAGKVHLPQVINARDDGSNKILNNQLLVIDVDDSVFVGGFSTTNQAVVAKLLNDGQLDSTVGTAGILQFAMQETLTSRGLGLGRLPDGSLIAGKTAYPQTSIQIAALTDAVGHPQAMLHLDIADNPTGSSTITIRATDSAGAFVDAVFLANVLTPSFKISNVASTFTGVEIAFGTAPDLSSLNLYDGVDAALDPADLTLVGTNTGPVRGSLVWNAATNTFEFVKTGGPLVADSYTLTLFSRADGFKNTTGELLDGDADGVPGGNFVTTFGVSNTLARVVSIPDFARGATSSAGQVINLIYDNGLAGLPISISDGSGVTSVNFDVVYNPEIIDFSSTLTSFNALPSGWTTTVNHGSGNRLSVSIYGTSPLGPGAIDLTRLLGSVPANAPYGASDLVRIQNLRVYTQAGGGNPVPSIADSALHKAIFIGDTNADGRYTAQDAGWIAGVGVNNYSGFDAHSWTDPTIVADVTQTLGLDGQDASWIARKALSASLQLQIPDIPIGALPLPPGVDPTIAADANVLTRRGATVNVPVRITDNAAGLFGVDVFVDYDTNVLDLATGLNLSGVDVAGMFLSETGWAIDSYVDDTMGKVRIAIYRASPSTGTSGQIANIPFSVKPNAPFGVTPLNVNGYANVPPFSFSFQNGSVNVVNQQPTDINLSQNTVLENTSTAAADLLFGQLGTVDLDPVDSYLYDLVSGAGDTDNARFNIVADQVFIKQGQTLDYESKPTYSVRVRSTDSGGLQTSRQLTLNVTDVNELIEITNRKVYYKGSDYATLSGIDAALDNNKSVLTSSTVAQSTTEANKINYSRGINGMVIDVAGLATTSLTASDFTFRVAPPGASGVVNPSTWASAPVPTNIVVTPGTGSTPARIRIEWADNAIQNTWLQVIVKANTNTGLSQQSAFYMGHAMAEITGGAPYRVTAADLSAVQSGISNTIVSVGDPRDINKDRRVTAADLSAVQSRISNTVLLNNITIPIAASTEEG
ncbi:MAG: PKD domain-containing protein, partial [Pirellula sp.]